MAYEFKKLADVESAETASEAANILVEDGGVIRRVPREAVAPEVEIPEIDLSEYAKKTDIPEGFSGSWNDLEDKPFGDYEVFETLIPEQEITSSFWPQFNAVQYSSEENDIILADGWDGSIVSGQKYILSLDGIDYECVSRYGVLGDAIHDEFTEGDIPFYIGKLIYGSEALILQIHYGNSLHGSQVSSVISLKLVKTVTETVDDKFISDYVKAKSDWNENDPESGSYIANKPFYEISGSELLFGEETVTLGEASPVHPSVRSNYNKLADEDFTKGDTYRVTLDGVEYICVAFQGDYNSTLGASGAYELDRGTPEYPFSITYGEVSVKTESDSVTLKVEHVLDELKTLDEKFLPDTVATKAYVDEKAGGSGGITEVVITGVDDVYTANITFEDLHALYDAKTPVRFTMVNHDSTNSRYKQYSVSTVTSANDSFRIECYYEGGYFTWDSDGITYVFGA